MPKMKTEDGKEFPAAAYAYVPDADEPSTWKLRLWEEPGGGPTMAQVGRAAAAFSPGGFRGQKVEIPSGDVAAVKTKIRAAYHKLDVKDEDIPEQVREAQGNGNRAREQEPMSLEGRAGMIRQAYRESASDALPPGLYAEADWDACIDVMDDALLVRTMDGTWRVPYTMAEDGTVSFETAQEVEVTLVPVSEAAEAGPAPPEGREWEVTIIRPGTSKNGYHYDRRVLEAALPLFRGIPVFAFELGRAEFQHLPDSLVAAKRKLPKNLVGRLTEVWQAADGAIQARLPILGADWLREKLMAAWRRGVEALGLSHDSMLSWTPARIGGRDVKLVQKFHRVDSVDVVTSPSAGGAFERAVAGGTGRPSGAAGTPREDGMKELLERLRQTRPDLIAALGENPTPERVVEAIAGALAGAPAVRTAWDEETKALKALLEEGKTFACRQLLAARVAEAKLPEPSAKGILKRFEGRVFEAKELELAIAEKKEELDALAKSGMVKTGAEDGGQRSVEALVEVREKFQAAMDKLAGLPAPDPAKAGDGIFDADRAGRARAFAKGVARAYESAAPFRGIRDAYLAMGGDLERFGAYKGEARATEMVTFDGRAQEEYTSATFSYALGNTLHRRLVNDYAQPNYGEDLVISLRRSTPDFKTQEAVRAGYFGDLSTVNPETGDYVDIAPQTDEEATYTVGQKGNLLTINRKAILNDDIGVLRRLPLRLGRAARRTHARFVWGFFIDNAAIYDAVAFFHANHGNLGSSALAVDKLQAAVLAMRKQTEPGSGERITFEGPFNLWTPPDLEWTAKAITLPGPDSAAKTAADTTMQGVVVPHVNSLMTDANDWVLTAPVSEIDIVEMGYINGMEQPELFLADQPTVGQMFVADKLQYKIRFEYGGTVVDFRGGYKAVVVG